MLYWFRTDLRLHDSPALQHALSLSPSALIPLWTWDAHYVFRQRGAANRWSFLVECMHAVDDGLRALNPRQKLWVVRASPAAVMARLAQQWRVDVLVFEKDTDAYARRRDEEVTRLVEAVGVKVVCVPGSRTLFDSDALVKANGGKPTMTMNQLVKAAEKVGDGSGVPARPVEAPTTLPDPLKEDEMDLSGLDLQAEDARAQNPGWPRVEGMDYNATQRTLGSDKDTQYSTGLMGPDRKFAIPTLKEMGIDPASVTSPHRGGEAAGLELLASHIAHEEYIATFEKPATAPTAFEPAATTLLSPHMHFGSVSCRKFWWDVQGVLERRKRDKKRVSDQPVNLPGQLLFRDMYFAAHAAVGLPFGQAIGNPVARFVPWHLQSRYSLDKDGKPVTDGTYVVDDVQAEEYFRRWKEGRTGFPWIDALMRQLRQEGWIHHLGRHAVACFLTRGGCYVSWERGAEVFEEWLIDHEVACNAGNWMWLSCTAFFSQFFRCYSPISFPKKWDPQGRFVRRYVPELEKYSDKYIYEPHKAPIQDQKAWGCVIKGDGSGTGEDGKGTGSKGEHKVYPKPMFDFNERRKFCIDRMKEAYDVGLYGNDEKVLNGEWKKVFDFDDKGGKRKEEANGEVNGERGTKRGRDDMEGGDEDVNRQDDMGEDADVGDETDAERGRVKKDKIAKKDVGKAKGKGQGTLDGMVTRGRAKK